LRLPGERFVPHEYGYLWGEKHAVNRFLKLSEEGWLLLPINLANGLLAEDEEVPLEELEGPGTAPVHGRRSGAVLLVDHVGRWSAQRDKFDSKWMGTVYQVLRKHVKTYLKADRTEVIARKRGELFDGYVPLRFASPNTVGTKWRLTHLGTDPFTASAVAIDVLCGLPSCESSAKPVLLLAAGASSAEGRAGGRPDIGSHITPTDDEFPSIHGVLTLAPGGFELRGEQGNLSGKAWEVLRAFVRSKLKRVTAASLLSDVWGSDSDATSVNVIDEVGKARKALQKAMKKSRKPAANPLPCVDKGRNLAWELRLQ
jgi:hypothetical protein